MAPTRCALQIMINVCKDYCDKYCLAFNTKKSKVVVFGKSHGDACLPLMIGEDDIEFVSKWKYLGTTISNGKTLSFSAKPDIASFFRATNAIFSVLGSADEQVLLTLIQTNCIPIITYACDIKQLTML